MRLASKQQASSKQQLDPRGPFWAPEQQGSRNRKKKCYHAIRDGFPQLSRKQLFFQSDPHRSETVIWWYFGPFWAWGTCRNSRPGPARAENTKMQFPSARGTFGGEIRPPKKFSPKLRNFLMFSDLADRTPPGREIAKYWVFRPF